MGETGCGKTRLLRYLCEIQDNVFKTKTLSCLKVSLACAPLNKIILYVHERAVLCRFMVEPMRKELSRKLKKQRH